MFQTQTWEVSWKVVPRFWFTMPTLSWGQRGIWIRWSLSSFVHFGKPPLFSSFKRSSWLKSLYFLFSSLCYGLSVFWVIYRRVLIARYLKTCAQPILALNYFHLSIQWKIPMRFINISSLPNFVVHLQTVFKKYWCCFKNYWCCLKCWCCDIENIVWRVSLVLISWLNQDEWQTLAFNRISHQKFAKRKNRCHRLSLANWSKIEGKAK